MIAAGERLAGLEGQPRVEAVSRASWGSRTGRFWRQIALTLITALFMLPFYWMVLSAFKERWQIFARPMQWFPDPIQWDNFAKALTYQYFPYFNLLKNSVFYAGAV